MKQKLVSLKFWETAFIAVLLIYIIDDIFLFSLFFVTIPLTFLIGVITSVFAIKDKMYLHAILSIIGIFLPICRFMMLPW